MGQAAARAPVTQRVRVRSPIGTVSWVRFFRGFSSPVRQMSGSFSPPKFPEYHLAIIIIIAHHSLRAPMTWDVDAPLNLKYTYHQNRLMHYLSFFPLFSLISLVYLISFIHLISLSKFNLPLTGTFTRPTPPGPYRATTCRRRELNYGSHTYFFDHTRTWRASSDEWSAQCWGHLRDNTNMKDDTHQAHTHSFQQGEYEIMIMTAKYSEFLWA